MFRRRRPLPIWSRIAAILWPRGGWRRASLYVAHRLGRLPGTPYRVAAGFACGAAISFTPFIGLHFVGAALLSLLLRGNLVASAIGTVIGNPWTFPLIWAWIYNLGGWLLGEARLADLPDVLTLGYIFDHPMSVLWPMTAGGVPTAIVAWFAFFFLAKTVVTQYQHARYRRLRRKIVRRRAEEVAARIVGHEAEKEG